MPGIVAKVEGQGNGIKTVIVNMVDIARALNREPVCKSETLWLLPWPQQSVYKNRFRDRFYGSKSRQVTGKRILGPNLRKKSRTGF
jgi:hypothetical protein